MGYLPMSSSSSARIETGLYVKVGPCDVSLAERGSGVIRAWAECEKRCLTSTPPRKWREGGRAALSQANKDEKVYKEDG